MTLTQRIEILTYLGKQIDLKDEQLLAVQEYSKHKNSWFTLENTNLALQQIASNFLQKEKLEAWAKQYELSESSPTKNVGIIMKSNPPLAGFHDLISVFMSGHRAKIKLAEDDKFLIPHLIKIMTEGFPEANEYFSIAERMDGFDAIIASGNQKSITTFEMYFSKFPNIIKKNKFGIAVLDGNESKEDLSNLGKDFFNYFGLSSRSISKIYVPYDYDFVPLLEATHEYNEIVLTNKYKNNFDFNYTLHLLNNVDYKANGCIMIIEDEALQSRIATLHYEMYKNESQLNELLNGKKEDTSHIVSNNTFTDFKNTTFGEANTLSLSDYENGIDVMDFLKNI